MATSRMDRYVARAVVGAYGATLLFLFSMFVVLDLLLSMNSYMEAAKEENLSVMTLAGKLFNYYLLGLPLIYVSIAPFVTVIACMFALSRLMAANEVGPMIFTGRSIYRVLRPMLAAGLFSGLVMAATWQWVMPVVSGEHQNLEAELKGKDADVSVRRVTLRDRADVRRELYCERYRHGLQLMEGVTVCERGERPGDVVIITAGKAQWNPEEQDWDLVDGWREADNLKQRHHKLGMPGVSPKQIMDSAKLRKQTASMSYSELRELQRMRRGKADFVLAYHVHMTFPLANIVLLLLALPFAVQFERGRKIERVVMSIVVCAGYLVVDLTCQNLVYKGYLMPVVAAWTPTIVFGSLGVAVFSGTRT